MNTNVLCLVTPDILDEVADRALQVLRRRVPELRQTGRAQRHIPVCTIGDGDIVPLKDRIRGAVAAGQLKPIRSTCVRLGIEHATAVLEVSDLEDTLAFLRSCVGTFCAQEHAGTAGHVPIVFLGAPELHPRVHDAFASMVVPNTGDTVSRAVILRIDESGQAVPAHYISLGSVACDEPADESLAA